MEHLDNVVGDEMPDFVEWTGATTDLEELANELGDLANRQFMAKLVDEISKEAIRLIKKEFETSTDPYGQPWAPLKKPDKGSRKGGPLRKTDSMYKSIRRKLTRDGFAISSDDPKISFHNFGTARMVKRQIFPSLSGLIPPGPSSIQDDLSPFQNLMQQALKAAVKKFDLDIFGESNESGVDEVDFSGGGFSFRKGT